MKKSNFVFKCLSIAALTLFGSGLVIAQSAVIRGEVSAGVYENLKSSGQALVTTSAGNISNIATYQANFGPVTVAAAATDIACIRPINSTKIIRVLNALIQFNATAGTVFDMYTVRRSTANTGGTAATVVGVSYDSTNAAATALAQSYTANPTTGTLVGVVDLRRLFANQVGTGIGANTFVWNASLNQPIVLRSATEQLCWNLNGITIAGLVFTGYFIWTEQ